MRQYGRGRGYRPPGEWGRSFPARRPAPPAQPLPTSVATALQEMGILYSTGASPVPSVWREVEELPRSVLLLLSLTCFLLLLGLVAWQPWR